MDSHGVSSSTCAVKFVTEEIVYGEGVVSGQPHAVVNLLGRRRLLRLHSLQPTEGLVKTKSCKRQKHD
jgi:hypothetical protein